MQTYNRTQQNYIHENGETPTSEEEIEYQQILMGRASEASNSERIPPSSSRPVPNNIKNLVVAD
jgi:hypothetical protein